MWYHSAGTGVDAVPVAPKAAAFPWASAGTTEEPLVNTVAAALAARQNDAARIVAQHGVIKLLTGPPTQRPDFASELEWQAVRSATANGATPQQDLLRRVNTMRFAKQLELWHTLSGEGDRPRRERVAAQLLSEIRQRVDSRDIGIDEARALESMLRTGVPAAFAPSALTGVADPASAAQP